MARVWGVRMGNAELVDGMYRDGFLDPLSGLLWADGGEIVSRYEISATR